VLRKESSTKLKSITKVWRSFFHSRLIPSTLPREEVKRPDTAVTVPNNPYARNVSRQVKELQQNFNVNTFQSVRATASNICQACSQALQCTCRERLAHLSSEWSRWYIDSGVVEGRQETLPPDHQFKLYIQNSVDSQWRAIAIREEKQQHHLAMPTQKINCLCNFIRSQNLSGHFLSHSEEKGENSRVFLPCTQTTESIFSNHLASAC